VSRLPMRVCLFACAAAVIGCSDGSAPTDGQVTTPTYVVGQSYFGRNGYIEYLREMRR
jgi:hypothetical protein